MSRLGAQHRAARGAGVKVDAHIHGHRLWRAMSALGAGQFTLGDHPWPLVGVGRGSGDGRLLGEERACLIGKDLSVKGRKLRIPQGMQLLHE